MWILQFNFNGKDYLLEWSLDINGPAPGAKLVDPQEMVKRLTDKGLSQQEITKMMTNVRHHGTSHTNAMSTVEKFLKKSVYRQPGKPVTKWTKDLIWQAYQPKEAPVELTAKKKESREEESSSPKKISGKE